MKNFLVGVGAFLATIFLWPFRALMEVPGKIQTVYQGSYIVKSGPVVIPLTNNQNDFFGELTLGTPKEGEPEQILRVQFDTAASTLWVAGVDSCTGGDCSTLEINPFNGTKSSTYSKFNKRQQQGFANNVLLNGHVSQDHFKLGNQEQSVVVKNQVFAEATVINGGVLEDHEVEYGLDLVSHQWAPKKLKPPVWDLTRRLTKPIFGFYFNNRITGPDAGKLALGGGDEDFYEGELNDHPVVKRGNLYNGWFIRMESICLQKGGQQLAKMPLDEEMMAHPDTGSNLVGGPKWAIDHLNTMILRSANLEYKEEGTFPCDKSKELPDVTFVMRGKEYVFEPREYIGRAKPIEANLCKLGFVGLYTPYFMLGQMFMTKYYTRFDVGNRLIQIAKAKHTKSPDKSTSSSAKTE